MNELQPLDYENRAKRSPAVTLKSGVIALIASVIQLPWMAFVMLIAWGDVWHLSSGSGSTHQDSMLYLVAAFVPAGVGIPCGIYSTWVAGFGKRNIGGSLVISIFAS